MSAGGFDHTDIDNSKPSSAGTQSTSTLVPITIKQILNAKQTIQDGPYTVNNLELNHICFVGVVRNVVDHTANITLTVEDGTGQIEFKKWSNDLQDLAQADHGENDTYSSQAAQEYQIGTYVKIFASLREFGGKMNIQFAVVKNIESFNQVISHHLEAMRCYAVANGLLPSSSNESQDGKSGNNQNLFVQDTEEPKTNLEKILDFCRQQCAGKDSNSFSVHTKLISQSLGLLEDDVRMYCQTLTEQGFIYPTFDEFSYFTL